MALIRYTMRQLEAFATVAELLSFGTSAERMGLTSQAVSQLIAELETLLGFRLFDRTTRRVVLSSGGRDFLASAQSVLHHVNYAEGVADEVRNRAAGIVRIGAPLVLASSVLPAAIRDFSAQRPKIVVRIRDLPVDSLIDTLAMGDGRCGFGGWPGPTYQQRRVKPTGIRQSVGALVRTRPSPGSSQSGAMERFARSPVGGGWPRSRNQCVPHAPQYA
jgi:DNA-binding transcriptional LysR family regulator